MSTGHVSRVDDAQPGDASEYLRYKFEVRQQSEHHLKRLKGLRYDQRAGVARNGLWGDALDGGKRG